VGEIRTPKAAPAIREDELPINVPKNWAWLRLCDIGRLSGGMTPSMNRSDFWDGNIVWLSPKDIKADEVTNSELKITAKGLSETRLELYRLGCLFMVARSGILKRIFPVSINRVAAAANQDIKVLVPFLDGQERYLQIMFRGLTDFILGELVKTGTTVQSLKYAEFEQQPFPLPPLAEQHRIVAKVDDLMALCDRLDAARAEREATRDRLAAASLARLHTPDPETFRDGVRFTLNALPALTTRPDQMKQLRQTILDLAVRGKLVPQDSNDKAASELLKEITTIRKKLYSEKKITKPRKLPSLDEIELPFSLPSQWAWCMLGDLCYQVSDGPHFSPQYVSPDEGVPFLSTRNIRLNGFDLSSVKYVSRADHEEFCKRIRPEKGDIIYTKGGTTGIAKVNDLGFEFSVWVHLAVLRIEKKRLYPRYVELALNSPHCYEQSQHYTQGTSNFDLGLTRMIKITIPLPPFAEQHRIVAKVDHLMALCDRLEASLTTADDTRCRLLEALLAEALTPAEALDREAAE
jgi:type I restriction enzyme S subunit